MTFKDLAQQTADTTQGREVQVRLLSREAEPSAREEPGWKGRQDKAGRSSREWALRTRL